MTDTPSAVDATVEHARTMARYNVWANARLYDACAALPAGELARDRRAFFGSILGTLNHMLVADRIWRGRIEGFDPAIPSLDTVLHEDFAELRAAREDEDDRWVALVDAQDAAALAAPVHYRTMAGSEHATRLGHILAHVVNHGTHHRGQAHGLLSQVPADPPPLDLIYYLREAGIS